MDFYRFFHFPFCLPDAGLVVDEKIFPFGDVVGQRSILLQLIVFVGQAGISHSAVCCHDVS